MVIFITSALRAVPSVNAAIDGSDIVYRDYADISVAVASPKGLVTPVIRDAQSMSFADVELKLGEVWNGSFASCL